MAKVAINLNEKLPCEDDDVGDPAQSLILGYPDPTPAAGTATDHAFNASAEPPLPPSDGGSNMARKEKESKKTVAVAGSLAVNSSAAPVDNIQKKIRRAERFGVPVQLSEAEKRSSRAERFGIGSGMKKSESLNKSEELKRKARAERFGILASEVVNDEEKKKARLERFASNTKTVSDEEEKRKARTIRFSNVPSPLSQVNSKAAVAGGDNGKS